MYYYLLLLCFYCIKETAAANAAKRAKIDVLISDEVEMVPTPVPPPKLPELIELSENFIAERLSVEIATDLVMDSMVCIMNSNLYLCKIE